MRSLRLWPSFLGLLTVVFLTVFFQNCAPQSSDPEILKSCVGSDCIDIPAPSTSCEFNDQTLTDGQSTTAYLESVAENCVQEVRTCRNGVLSGNYEYPSCSQNTSTPKSCRFNNQTIASGSSVDAYLASAVPSTGTCAKQVRRCTDGVLSGTYQYASCAVAAPEACLFGGRTIAHGTSVRAFLHSSSPSSQNLCETSQLRVCNNGTLSGSYTHSSCAVARPRSCDSLDGRTLPHGGSVRAYRNSTAAFGSTACQVSELRTCQDGSLSGSYLHSSCEVNAPATCRFDGKAVPHGGSVRAFQHSSAPHANSAQCNQTQTRTCNNGVLSGSYTFASCQVNAPRSCRFDGKTVAHNGTIVGYASSTGVRGQAGACQAVTKTCRDGTLSHPNAQFGSCTLTSPKACLFRGQTIPHGDSVYAYPKASNGGVGRCIGESRFCNNGVLSGTATFESCLTTCKYGKFNLNSDQVILISSYDTSFCTDPKTCRIFTATTLWRRVDSNGKNYYGCQMNAISCSVHSGNGEVNLMRYGLQQKNNNFCGNPRMSTPIPLSSLVSFEGGPIWGGMTVERNINQNGSLLWKSPYPFRGPVP